MGLPEIEAHVAKQEWDEALGLALSEWRACKAPAWANLIDAISAKVSRAAIPGSSVRWGHPVDEWGSRARSHFAIDIPVLLDAFGRDFVFSPPHDPRAFESSRAGARVKAALDKENESVSHGGDVTFALIAMRLEDLSEFGADPRVPKGLVRFLELAPITAQGAIAIATYAPAYDFIAEIGDTRVLPLLEQLPATPARDRAIAALSALPTPAVADEVMELAKALGFVPAGDAVDITELLAMVASDLTDDTPRSILADLWLEAGNARGEFVALQLRAAKGQTSDAELDRMNTLEAQGKNEWVGDIALITREVRFHRGFLDEITLAADSVVAHERWEEMVEHPALATVRMLRPGLASPSLVSFFARVLPNLQELEVTSAKGFRDIVEAPRKLARIELNLPWTPAPPRTIRPPPRPVPTTEVRTLIERGFERVTVPYSEARTIGEHSALLNLATEKSSVVLRAMDALFTATRGESGLLIEMVSRDSFTVNAVLDACPDAKISLLRPRGANLYGWNGDAARLTERLKKRRATLDASWRKMLKL